MAALADQLAELPTRAPTFSNELRLHDAAAVTADREWVEVSDSAVVEWRDGNERTLLELQEPRFHWICAGLCLREDGSWVYGAASLDALDHVDVTFLASTAREASTQLTHVAISTTDVPMVWAPLPDDDPSGVLVSAGSNATLHVDRVTRSGAQRIADLDAVRNFYPPGASICRLPDGRIVLAALNDDPRVAQGVILYVIGSSGATEVRLPPCNIRPLREVFTAISPTGVMCVLARSERGELAAAVVDVDHPETAQFRAVTPGDDHARISSVVHAEDRFVIAWLSDADGAVTVRELRDDRVLLPPVTIAPDGHRDIPLLILRPTPDGVSLLARTRHGLMLWHLSTPIAGRAAALTLVRANCRANR